MRREHFDLAVFYAEQALQLRLKSLVLRLLGFVPRIHSVREMLGLFTEALKEIDREDLTSEVSEFSEANRDGLRVLDEAYIASRYLLRVYELEDAKKSLSIVDKAFRLLDSLEGDLFGV